MIVVVAPQGRTRRPDNVTASGTARARARTYARFARDISIVGYIPGLPRVPRRSMRDERRGSGAGTSGKGKGGEGDL